MWTVRCHELGSRVHALFPTEAAPSSERLAGVGSVLLLLELLTKPLRAVTYPGELAPA
jgi:hypothetical protein